MTHDQFPMTINSKTDRLTRQTLWNWSLIIGHWSLATRHSASFIRAFRRLLPAFTLLVWLFSPLSSSSAPASYNRIHSFGFTNRVGVSPFAGVIVGRDGLLYGTTELGGLTGGGTIFKVNTNGTGYVALWSFGTVVNDGRSPDAALLEGKDGALYGTTYSGGASNDGTVFRINKDGSGYAALHSFQGVPSDGASPSAALVQAADGVLYGTTSYGGTNDGGTLFKINTNGLGFALLHSFGSTAGDGLNPVAALVGASDGAFYGTTFAGGTNGAGTVFKLAKVSTSYTYVVLQSFQGNATDGGTPLAPLIEATNGVLYGTTSAGGISNAGTVFKLNKNGASYASLHDFRSTTNEGGVSIAALWSGSDGVLYGTTEYGGAADAGTVFRLNRDGIGYTNLWSFGVSNGDGQNPSASLIEGSNGVLYGTTYYGGSAQAGTVFKLKKDGSGYAVLWSFERGGGDGLYPQSALVEGTNGLLYGSTYYGGSADLGTIFAVNKDGSGYTVLKSLDSSGGDGAHPTACLCLGDDGLLYGTTEGGGAAGLGTVFKLSQNGSGYSVLRSFGNSPNDGQTPDANLLQASDGLLYGTTSFGGDAGYGTIFKMNRDGMGYSVLWSFGVVDGDGQTPKSALIEAKDGLLYGTTREGGTWTNGTAFQVNRDGADYIVLWNFGSSPDDGRNPTSALVEGSDGLLYGTTQQGGSAGYGIVFKLDRSSASLAVLWNFGTTLGDGQGPIAALVEGFDSVLYGTTSLGGDAGFGAVFRINRDGAGYTVLWSFSAAGAGGQYPSAGLLQGSDGALYTTTSGGGDLDFGAISRLVLPPFLFNPASLGNAFRFQFRSVSNVVYHPQFRPAMSNSNWVFLPDVVGTGRIVTLTDTNQNSSARFYRVVIP